MNFNLGIDSITKVLAQKPYTLRGRVIELGTPLKVQCTLVSDKDIDIEFYARQLLPQSFSYEVDDEVIVEVRSFCEAYVLGLASDIEGTNTDEEFHIRLGKNILKGRKDGKLVEFICGDDGFHIKHTMTGTSVETTGILTLTGDMVSIGDGIAFGLNCMTACPLQGVHVPTQQKVLF